MIGKWIGAIQVKLDSLNKQEVFGSILRTPNVRLVRYTWVFIRKRNENIKYKVHIVVHGFSQRPEIVDDETYLCYGYNYVSIPDEFTG